MWRSFRMVAPKTRVPECMKLPRCFYATSPPSGKGKKAFITIITMAGVTMGGTIAYGKYDPKFRKMIEDNIPYSDVVFKSIPDWESKPVVETKAPIVSDKRVREEAIESGLLKKKQERQKKEEKPRLEESKPADPEQQKEVKSEPSSMPKPVDKSPAPNVDAPEKRFQYEIPVTENTVKNLIAELERSTKQAVSAGDAAVEAIRLHTEKLYLALDKPQGPENEEFWKQADLAGSQEKKALSLANEKIAQSKTIIAKLEAEVQKCAQSSSKSPMLYFGEEALQKAEKQLKEAESKVSAAHAKVETAVEYKDLVKKARDQFRSELQVVLPKYVHKSKDQSMTEDELNLLIAHAHRRIENLQKDLAKHQVTEKQRLEEAKMMQKIEDEKSSESKILAEISRRQKKLELDFQKQLDVVREQFEADMRQQLRRQAAVHADHLQEALHIQQQEMIRRQKMELDEKLLQQKGNFISQISESMSQVKGIENYLRARAELDESTQKAQALWLACQAMKNTIHSGFCDIPKPLGKELAVAKAAASGDSSFIATVLAGFPSQAIKRGIYTDENLKQRFDKVKRICRKVAMVDDDNRSLYRYLLSYLQSFLIIDSPAVPKEEVDAQKSSLDTYDILNVVSYCLERNDFEKALYYASQLKGEPRNIARDWVFEVKLLLETSQAVDCLITYAAAIGVQAYH